MERDNYLDDGSILFSTLNHLRNTDGYKILTLATSPEAKITGFKQVNSTHIIMASFNNHCLYILNRQDLSTNIFAGTYKQSGNSNGRLGHGRFNSPWAVELDTRDQGKLLVTDFKNNALRSVDLRTGEITTVIRRSSLKSPRQMAWSGNNLLITNINHVTQVSWSKDNQVFDIQIIGSPHKVGEPIGYFQDIGSVIPYSLTKLGCYIYLMSDWARQGLALIDLKNHMVKPICFDQREMCTVSTSLPGNVWSALRLGSVTYVAMSTRIFLFECKFTGY